MSEVLAVVGFASSILEIIDSAARLTSDAAENSHKGSTIDFEYLNGVSGDLLDFCAALGANSNSEVSTKGGSGRIDSALTDLADACVEEAKRLISKLAEGLPQKHARGPLSYLSSIRSAGQRTWNQSDLDDINAKLQGLRSALALKLLATVNARSRQEGNDVVEILSINRSSKSTVESTGVILTRRNGEVQTVLLPSQGDLHQSRVKHGRESSATFSSKSNQEATEAQAIIHDRGLSKIAADISDVLWYRSMDFRQQGVADAHDSTFRWIFHSSDTGEQPWDDFSEWLLSDRQCYWINGKAGSGKSTLMKYIWNDPLLEDGLTEWRGSCQLLTASFFLWRAGQPIQRSQEGLLRALLHQLLRKRPELAPACLPSVCKSLTVPEESQNPLELTLDELKSAFLILLQNIPVNTKVFILIDGLDEYEGEVNDMIELCLGAIQCRGVKLLVSSRPLPACVGAFSRLPKLQLQDLTKNDILTYVQDNLCNQTIMGELERLEPGISTELADAIMSKASGVFLWVILVTRSLREGLERYDKKKNLFLRLEQLPPDLEKLYSFMLDQMSVEDQRQASLMLQLLDRATQVQNECGITALQFSMAEQDPPDTEACLEPEVEYITPEQEDTRCKVTERRMRSRCCGLIEVQRVQSFPGFREKHVAFLHRTVIEFLHDPAVWKRLADFNHKSSTDLDHLLLASSVYELRCKKPEGAKTIVKPRTTSKLSKFEGINLRPVFNIIHAMRYCWTFQQQDSELYLAYIDAMWTAYKQFSTSTCSQFDKYITYKVPLEAFDLQDIPFPYGFLLYASSKGLGKFIVPHMKHATAANVTERSLLLLHVLINLNSPSSNQKMILTADERGVQIQQLAASAVALLQGGTNPNEACMFWPDIETANVREDIRTAVRMAPAQDHGITPWLYWLSCSQERLAIAETQPQVYGQVLHAMFAAGASLEGQLGGIAKQKTVLEAANECVAVVKKSASDADMTLVMHMEETLIKAIPPQAGTSRRSTASSRGSSRLSGLLRRMTLL